MGGLWSKFGPLRTEFGRRVGTLSQSRVSRPRFFLQTVLSTVAPLLMRSRL